jgi:hypothetical protein
MESGGPFARPTGEGTVTVNAVALGATVDGLMRLGLEDGSERQLSVPDEMSEHLRPGERVVLYDDPNGELLGWYLPEHGVGQDLRQ